MNRFVAGVAVTAVVLGGAWLYVAHFGGKSGGGPSNGIVGTNQRQEWTVLVLMFENGVCKMGQKQPDSLHTSAGRVVHWVIEGNCPGHTISIERSFKYNGQSIDILEPGQLSAPASAGGPPITATLKQSVDRGDYKYTILIDGQAAQYASLADDGDMYVCPVWPC
jgi:hypothetical protein